MIIISKKKKKKKKVIKNRHGKKLLSALEDMSEKRKQCDSTLASNPLEEATNSGMEPGKLKRRKIIVETTDYSERGVFEFFDKLAGVNSGDRMNANRQCAYRYALASLGEPNLTLGQINKLIGPVDVCNLFLCYQISILR